MPEEREVEEGEEHGPAGREEDVARAVAHREAQVVVVRVVHPHEPPGDGDLHGHPGSSDGWRRRSAALRTSIIPKRMIRENTT